jgi:hypothetical protein
MSLFELIRSPFFPAFLLNGPRNHRGAGTAILACCIILGHFAGGVERLSALPQSSPAKECGKSGSASGSQKKGKGFTVLFAGTTITDYGVRLGFSDYRASDGEFVTVLYWDFDSPQKAAEVFDKEIAKAASVVKREKMKDQKGEVVGERAEIVILSDDPEKPTHAVLSTDGVKFHEMRSRSLRHVLELEKIYRY